MRILSYANAIAEATVQAMKNDDSIFVTGIGVGYSSGVFGTTSSANVAFENDRIFESPSMENAITGICLGAAAMGMRPLLVHYRNDFLFLSLDQLINLCAKWNYMFGGNTPNAPLVIRAIIGRGWGQGATHSQSIQATLAHYPGLCVLMPTFPQDAKGMLISALKSNSTVIILEHRSLFELTGEVPEEIYEIKLGKAKTVREGSDLTIVATSFMVLEAISAAKFLESHGLSIEIIDLRSIKPLDKDTILDSVRKTGHLIVADTSWVNYGVASEISALVAEEGFSNLKKPIIRIGLPNCPAPTAKTLEDVYYPTALDIASAALQLLERTEIAVKIERDIDTFRGPY
jgi:pyruvate/2-oxoglutarate/acetoin dehydrogenase E1 component